MRRRRCKAGEGLGVAVELVGKVSCAGVLLIDQDRRWRGSEAVAAAGELCAEL